MQKYFNFIHFFLNKIDFSFYCVPFTMTYSLIFSDTDRSSTLSGRPQPDSVEDLSVLNLPE